MVEQALDTLEELEGYNSTLYDDMPNADCGEGGINFEVVMGITLGLLGSILINTGNNVQALGLHQLESKVYSEHAAEAHTDFDPHTVPPIEPSQSRTWCVGTAVFVGGSLLNFASYTLAAQSLLASLEAIQFVSNLIFGKFVHHNVVTRKMIAGTLLIICGVLLTISSSSSCEASFDVQGMIELYYNPVYQLFLVVIAIGGVVLYFIQKAYEAASKAGHPMCFASVVEPCAFATFSALFGTQSVVQAKCLSTLLALASDGEAVFTHWFVYAVLVAWLLTVGVWLYQMNAALGKYNALFIIPLLQVNFIFFAIVSGGIYFKEFNSFVASQWVGFWSGIAIIFTGLFLLSPDDVSDGGPEEKRALAGDASGVAKAASGGDGDDPEAWETAPDIFAAEEQQNRRSTEDGRGWASSKPPPAGRPAKMAMTSSGPVGGGGSSSDGKPRAPTLMTRGDNLGGHMLHDRELTPLGHEARMHAVATSGRLHRVTTSIVAFNHTVKLSAERAEARHKLRGELHAETVAKSSTRASAAQTM